MRFRSFMVQLAALVLASCGGGGDPGPMSGQQLLAGRDIGDVFFWKQRTLVFTRETEDPSQPEPQDAWIWRLDEPAPEVALTGIDWALPLAQPRWFAGDLLLTGRRLERLYDLAARQAVTLSMGLARQPGDGGVPDAGAGRMSAANLVPLVAMRSDGGGVATLQSDRTDTIIVGRPGSLQTITVPGDGIIGTLAFLGDDLVFAYLQQVDSDTLVGINRLAVASGTVTRLVPATPAAEWLGVTGFCDTAPLGERCGLFGVVGCTADEPPCPDGNPPPCHVLYGKRDPSDRTKTALYAHDVAAGSSTRLAGDRTDRLFASREHHQVVWGSTVSGTTEVIGETFHWNVCTGARHSCLATSPGDIVVWRPDGGAFATFEYRDRLAIAGADGSCTAIPDTVAGRVTQAQFSPAGDRLLWIADDPSGASAQILFVAAADGTSPTAVASGLALGARFSGDGRGIYMGTFAETTAALSWFDLATWPPVEQRLSSNYGQLAAGGNRRALLTDHWNSQDGSGEAVVIDNASGQRHVLGRSVTNLATSGNVDEAGGDVAYSVRGRGASARDGLWLTTLP
jgi:hypothetical protein